MLNDEYVGSNGSKQNGRFWRPLFKMDTAGLGLFGFHYAGVESP